MLLDLLRLSRAVGEASSGKLSGKLFKNILGPLNLKLHSSVADNTVCPSDAPSD